MGQLQEAGGQASASLREFHTATEELREAAYSLQEEVARFKVRVER
jgi:hypothetical protein